MDREYWLRVETIFHACVHLSDDRRDDVLESRCAGDSTLRADVEAVLEASRHADGFIEGIVRGAADTLWIDDDPPPTS